MGTRTLMRKTLRFLMWGFDKRLHKSRFAAFDEKGAILASVPPPHSLLLGVNLLKQFYVVRPTQTRRELGNMLVVAPTRGGKGLLATTQLFTWGGSVIVNDLKGDLFKYTAGYRATLGDVYVMNPIKGIGHRYDPLRGYTTEHELFLACHKLLYEKSEADPFWTDSAIQMLTQIFVAARLENQPLFPYTRHIVRLGLPDASHYLQTVSPEIATQFLGRSFHSVDFENARQLHSTWLTLTSKLQYFLSEIVVKSLAVSDFNVSDLILGEKPVTIYLQWPERYLKAISPLIRLIVGSLIDELVACFDERDGKGCKPVLILADEATRTAIPSLAEHATTVVGRDISLWVAVQSLKALEVVYGADTAQVLRDNMESQIYYRPDDLLTAKYLENRTGTKSAYAHSQTMREGAETSNGLSEQGVPLMTAQQIMQMREHQVLLFHRNLPPLRIHRVSWIGNSTFEKYRKIPPPTLSAIPECEVSLNTQTNQNIDGYVNPYMLLNRHKRTELEQELSN